MPLSANVVEVEYFRNPLSAISMARTKSARDMSATYPKTSVEEGSWKLALIIVVWVNTVHRESFSVFGIDPFATNEGVLNEQQWIVQLQNQSLESGADTLTFASWRNLL